MFQNLKTHHYKIFRFKGQKNLSPKKTRKNSFCYLFKLKSTWFVKVLVLKNFYYTLKKQDIYIKDKLNYLSIKKHITTN